MISRLSMQHTINSNASAYREWNFERPMLNLQATDFEPDHVKAPNARGLSLEHYEFPHLYQLQKPGDRYVKLQLLRQLTFRRWIDCEADVSRFLPGFTFTVHSHPRPEVNADWWVTQVRHEGKQPGVLEHEAPVERGIDYRSFAIAIPSRTRYVPAIRHRKQRVEGLQSAIVTGPAGEEVFCDPYGRVKVQFHWDREGKNDENSSCWVRVADTWAGQNFGFIQVPRIGQEVLVEYMEGDPDRPVITGRVYNKLKMPPWELPAQKKLSGIQSREFQARRRNQLVFDDTKNEIQAQVSCDHELSQINLGYITRINHLVGRRDFRGEGFDVRTDAWAALRAARGMYFSTSVRDKAAKHHKDMPETVEQLDKAVAQHEHTVTRAETHQAQDEKVDGDLAVQAIRRQAGHVKGNGEPHCELMRPHILLSSPAGIEMAAAGSVHVHTKENTAVSAEGHMSVSADKSFLAVALDKVRLFADNLGMRLFAGKGKLEIQAQSDAIDIIAEKVARIISAKGPIRFSSPKEILFTAGGSYMRINGKGIEKGTKGLWHVRSASQVMTGPASMDYLVPTWEKAPLDLGENVTVWDELERPVKLHKSAKKGYDADTATPEGDELDLFNTRVLPGEKYKTKVDGRQHVIVTGNAVPMTEEYDADKE